MIEENKRNILKLTQLVWNQGALTLARPLLDISFTYQGSFNPEPMDAQGYLDYVRSIREAVTDLHVSVEELVAENEAVVAHLSMSGELSKPVFGFEPSDRIVTVPVVSIFHLRHGRVRSLLSIYDVESIKRQLGIFASTTSG